MITREEIPPHLESATKHALAWFNTDHGTDFELTGLAEPVVAQITPGTSPFMLSLILCDGDICARKDIEVTQGKQGWSFLVQENDDEIPPLLDPPKGHRSRWIDDQLEKHDFILLLFYRGRW